MVVEGVEGWEQGTIDTTERPSVYMCTCVCGTHHYHHHYSIAALSPVCSELLNLPCLAFSAAAGVGALQPRKEGEHTSYE